MSIASAISQSESWAAPIVAWAFREDPERGQSRIGMALQASDAIHSFQKLKSDLL